MSAMRGEFSVPLNLIFPHHQPHCQQQIKRSLLYRTSIITPDRIVVIDLLCLVLHIPIALFHQRFSLSLFITDICSHRYPKS